jgi:ribonuclease HII
MERKMDGFEYTWQFWLAFGCGTFTGTLIGFFTCALLARAREADVVANLDAAWSKKLSERQRHYFVEIVKLKNAHARDLAEEDTAFKNLEKKMDAQVAILERRDEIRRRILSNTIHDKTRDRLELMRDRRAKELLKQMQKQPATA